MEGTLLDWLKVIIIMQLFFSASITILAHAMPSDTLSHVQIFKDEADRIGFEEIGSQVQDTLGRQTSLPVVELGSLIFYSGNILVDFILNFAFAIPEMIGLLVNGIMLIFAIDSYAFAIAEIFAAVAVGSMYVIGLVQTLLNLRSQGRIA